MAILLRPMALEIVFTFKSVDVFDGRAIASFDAANRAANDDQSTVDGRMCLLSSSAFDKREL
jgi:hypothetical protein